MRHVIHAVARVRTEFHARLYDAQNVFRRVRAIDIASGEIHHRLGAVQKLNPFADVRAASILLPDSVARPAVSGSARRGRNFAQQFPGEGLARKTAAARQTTRFLSRDRSISPML